MQLLEQFEEYRRQQANRVKQERLRIEEETAKLRADVLELDQLEYRLDDPPWSDSACPACFFQGRTPSSLQPIPSESRNDRFKCPACSYEVEVEHEQ